jgi:DNA repair protein RecO (recombination protein O)
LSVNALKVLRLLQRGSFADVARLRLSPDLMAEIELVLRGYVRYVLEQNPRSLQFVDAIRRTPEPLARVAESAPERYVPSHAAQGR